ncbi:MAG: hypothetical protein LR008_02515 [Candidatus Pacebacteria bacterium]|nr:hypothetical protein [Candidatus Paceibacterota bacterium]
MEIKTLRMLWEGNIAPYPNKLTAFDRKVTIYCHVSKRRVTGIVKWHGIFRQYIFHLKQQEYGPEAELKYGCLVLKPADYSMLINDIETILGVCKTRGIYNSKYKEYKDETALILPLFNESS